MNIHNTARLTPRGRLEMVRAVEAGMSKSMAARVFHTSRKTVRKWVERYHEGGAEAMFARSSRPKRSPTSTPAELVRQAAAFRHDHRLSQRECGIVLSIPRSTIGRRLRRVGLGRLPRIDPQGPIRRYERQAAGELIHLDVKKLVRFRAVGHRITGDRSKRTRGVGWQFIHVAVDDDSRAAHVEALPDEKAVTTVAFLHRAVAWFAGFG